MSKNPLTRKQKDVLEVLSKATSSKTADWVYGDLFRTAMNMADKGILNLRLSDRGQELFWIRGEDEPATGATVAAGFVVILNRNIQEPSGKSVNFFLARTKNYDLTQKSFQEMLAKWLRKLKLSQRDIIQSIPIEQVSYDERMFQNPGHVILED